MYFADLSTFTYYPTRRKGLNVGWLDKFYDFPCGPTPPGFVERLIEICKRPVTMNLGSQPCGFCSPEIFKTMDYQQALDAGIRSSTVIQVIGRTEVIYYSPGMIRHYVAIHGYRPPEEYITAVMQIDMSRLSLRPFAD